MAIVKVEHWVFRAPVAEPVANAFGAMSNRPALFMRISASDGAWGWGEVFCNFPQVGAEHRARLISSIFAPLLAGFADDADAQKWFQPDRIHPIAAAHPRMLDNVWQVMAGWLKR